MNPVEDLEIKRNNFTKWFLIALIAINFFAFVTSFSDRGAGKWIFLGGLAFFSVIFWGTLRYKIMTSQEGFTIYNAWKSTRIQWKDITSLNYGTYFGNRFGPVLIILYEFPQRRIDLQVKQFQKEKMQRFFEMLHEQCPLAIKNEYFIKQAMDTIDWKDKINM